MTGAGDTVTGYVTMTFSKEMVPTMTRALLCAAASGEFDEREAGWLLDWVEDIG